MKNEEEDGPTTLVMWKRSDAEMVFFSPVAACSFSYLIVDVDGDEDN